MEKSELSGGGLGFQRRPGGRGGCGCCGLWFTGLLALPLAALAALLVII
ncbi:MAG: hypothetical protein WCD37_20880 [Chloroflexia bacterium]